MLRLSQFVSHKSRQSVMCIYLESRNILTSSTATSSLQTRSRETATERSEELLVSPKTNSLHEHRDVCITTTHNDNLINKKINSNNNMLTSWPLCWRKLTFDLSLLPPQLQLEFDVESNYNTLRFLLQRKANSINQESDLTLNNFVIKNNNIHNDNEELMEQREEVVEKYENFIQIMPTWVYNVSWVCNHCHMQWMARPADRLNPQIAQAHNCPRCSELKYISSAKQTLSSSLVEDCNNTFRAPKRLEQQQQEQQQQHESNFNNEEHKEHCNTINTMEHTESSQEPESEKLLLVSAYPSLAAQWDVKRNNLLPYQVVVPLQTVECNSTMLVWWNCPHCRRPWREAINSRVARYTTIEQNNHKSSVNSNNNVSNEKSANEKVIIIQLCPSCEARGSSARINRISSNVFEKSKGAAEMLSSTRKQYGKRYLIDDELLMSEIVLRPHDDPATISLESESLFTWSCRYCQYEFVASAADRALRHVRCPQCSGAVVTEFNALLTQRPDVIHELSSSISYPKLSKLTIYSLQEVTFVCRRCCSPYRMSVRARCAIPKGLAACSKCFLAQSTAANKMLATLPFNAEQKRLTRKQRNEIRQAALRSMRVNYSKERLKYVKHALQSKDNALLN